MNFRLKEQLEWILSMIRWILIKKESLDMDESFVVVLNDVKKKLESLMES